MSNYACPGKRHSPICLYDFAMKQMIPDFYCLSVADVNPYIKVDYFSDTPVLVEEFNVRDLGADD